MLYVQVIYENGVIVETKAMSEEEAIAAARKLLLDKNADYERVRVIRMNGEQVFDQQVHRP